MLEHGRITKASKHFFLITMTAELSKYLNEQRGVFYVKQQK